MLQLSVCPGSLSAGFSTYSPQVQKSLFDGTAVSHILPYEDIASDHSVQREIQSGNGRISLSGVQPKFSMVLEHDTLNTGHLRFSSEGEQGHYILKPAPTSYIILYRQHCPANEHLSMQIAHQVFGIETAANALCFWGNGNAAYLTRRFDISPKGGKYAMEDFASLGGFTKANGGSDFKYNNMSYEECAEIIRKHTKAAPVEILKFFRIILFNYLISNDDAHLKNFSLIEYHAGDYVLAPAYDLMNTFLHLSQPGIFALSKGLFREGMPRGDIYSIRRATFREFGQRIGLPDKLVDREIDMFSREYPMVKELIHNSFLPEQLKDLYFDTYNYRRFTLSQ